MAAVTICSDFGGPQNKVCHERQVRWSGIPISFKVKGFGIVNKAEIDVFLELSSFFDDPAYVGS